MLFDYTEFKFKKSNDGLNDWLNKIKEQPCMIEQFFKDNPDAKMACITCSCPRCTIRC